MQPLTTDTRGLVSWMTGGGGDEGGRRSASNEWLAYTAFRTNALTICRFVQQQRRGEKLQAAQAALTGALGHLSDDARRLLQQQVGIATRACVENPHRPWPLTLPGAGIAQTPWPALRLTAYCEPGARGPSLHIC